MPWWVYLFWSLSALLALAAAALLYFALFHDRARARRRCPRCWYDMAGIPGLRCPECGREARHERRLHRTRRHWKAAALAAALAALSLAAWVTPGMLVAQVWWTGLPRPARVVLFLFYDDDEFSILGSFTHGQSRTIVTNELWPPGQIYLPNPSPLSVPERLLVAFRCAQILDDADMKPASLAGFRTGPIGLGSHTMAIEALSSLGSQAWPAGRALFRRLEHKPEGLEIPLGNAAARSGWVGAQLGRLALDAPWSRSVFALKALAIAGRGARSQRANVLAALEHAEGIEVATQAAATLNAMGPPAETLRAFRHVLESSETGPGAWRARAAAVWGLGLIRSKPTEVIELIRIAAHDTRFPMPAQCVSSLRSLGKPALSELIRFADDPDDNLAAEAAHALWSFGHDAAPAVPALIRDLTRRDLNLRNHAAIALGYIGAAASTAIPALEAMRTDPEPRLACAASDALTMIAADQTKKAR